MTRVSLYICHACGMSLSEGEACRYARLHYLSWLYKHGLIGGPNDGAGS
jgi:hypothetical protein